MDQARTTISKFLNGEPHSYTRFNLTQNMEGDNSQVEMKLSSDMEEEVGGNGVGEHLNHRPPNKPYMAQSFRLSPKNLCVMTAVTLLLFIVGYFIGYWSAPTAQLLPPTPAISCPKMAPPHETGAAPLMRWSKVKDLLAQKLSASNFEAAFRDFSIDSHRAGSVGDEVLRNKVVDKFTQFGMKPWTDVHYVKVQDPPASGYNSITFKNAPEKRLSSFLSYSGNAVVKGTVVYGHYGQLSELTLLVTRNLNLTGKVLLLRAGKISYAEKVANAAKMEAAAVLIYADPFDHSIGDNTELYGHVHLGSGDPYTPGFPSFNHTLFPPVQSSGLPTIVAQTLTTTIANEILKNLGGQDAPDTWGCFHKVGGEMDNITVEVNNVLVEKKINNIFGVIEGLVDADRYIVIGAQRDAWGPGFATSTVGTSVLIELARSISEMKNEGFKPRRSIVFASWSAGEYGSVGATEWLEGYMAAMNLKAFSYINLDGIVAGRKEFKVAASPLLHALVQRMLNEVDAPSKDGSLLSQFSKGNWESNILEPLKTDNAAYPFVAFSGIPSLSFRFSSGSEDYQFFGTKLDTRENLDIATDTQVAQLAEVGARFAGQVVLRLVHDHLLQMDLLKYSNAIRIKVAQINAKVRNIQRMKPELLPKSLTTQWLASAANAFNRATLKFAKDLDNSDTENIETCRLLNDRLMSVERNFLSPYVSPTERPFRHIILGSGNHTLAALSKHLDDLRTGSSDADEALFRHQFALATWTIQGSAISLAGDIWALESEI